MNSDMTFEPLIVIAGGAAVYWFVASFLLNNPLDGEEKLAAAGIILITLAAVLWLMDEL